LSFLVRALANVGRNTCSNPGQGLGVNDVTSFITGPISTSYLNYLTPGNAIFNNPKAVFASNARTIAIVGKFTF